MAQATPVKTLERAVSTVQETAAKVVEAVAPTTKKQDLDNVVLLQGAGLAAEAELALASAELQGAAFVSETCSYMPSMRQLLAA